ncbi:enhanced entry virulence factor RtxA [Legionella pneumophila]|uniref:enhanced entry virulence factor RtxA n=1 Tax=Legionella pneumophila TaxID=446 RepID=UPI0012602519|nr:enhanced entry virulence factor RtxA [Legionella pneumophila]
MLVESVIGIVRAVNGLLEKVNAQGQASLVKSGARLEEGDVLTLLSGEAYIQFIHGFPEALALGKPVKLDGISPTLQYGVEDLNEQLVQEAIAKGIDPSVILDVLGSAAAGAVAVGSGGDAFIIDPLFGFGQVTAGYPTGPISFAYEADTQQLFWFVPEETGVITESELTSEPESIPQIPQFTTNQAVLTVFEDALPSGIPDSAGQARIASSSLSSLLTSSPDVAASFAFNTNYGALPKLTSDGIDLVYSLSANNRTLSASIPNNGPTVMQFELTADGQLTQTLMDSIDHPTADSDDSEWMRLDLSPLIDVTFTRTSDGTVLESRTLPANAVIAGIQDDVPLVSATQMTSLVDEDGLAGGLAGGVGDVAGQAVAASGNVAALFQSGADAPLSYSLNPNTSGLPALSSGGVALTYAVSGNTLTASANGTDVFTFTLGSNGNYTFTLLAKLDHPAGADENDILINLGSVIRATDSDGDTVVAAADGLVVTVDDDTPIASTNKLTGVVDEDGLAGGLAGGVGDVAGQAVAASGNVAALFQSGADAPLSYSLNPNTSGLPALSSGGVALTYAVSGNTLTASANGTDVFTFTLGSNGNYTFTLLAKLDHPAGADENDILINLGSVIRATDSDGDTVVAAADGLVVTVDDDTPIASATKLTGVVDEDGLAGGLAGGTGDVAGQAVAASGNVAALFQSGADAPLSYSLNPNTSGLPALSSGGVALTYAVSGNTLTASANGTDVFTFTLGSNGNYTFTLLAKLDHPAGADENDILINLGSVIRATDSDGDTVVAAADGLVVTVDDDTPIASTNKLTGVVDEDGLAGGLAGGVGDVAGQAVAASGNVAALFQSGADAPLSYSLNPNTSGLPALSSGGVALTYAVSGNTLTASANGTDVFTFTLGSNGNYTFTLLAKLDHPAGADENDILINLGSVIRATDSDGDTVVAAADGLVVTVDDDTPIASTNKLTGVVDEDGLAGGLAGGVGDVAGQAVAASGNVAALFQSGADAPLSYSLNPNTSGLPALSSGGVALTYAVSGNTLTASANGTDVFTFTLGSNGNYTFTLLAKLDHPAGADENDILINLGSVIRATDSDGDTVVAAADGLVVTVDDDTPIASATKLTGVVDEDGLAGGLAGGVGDVAGQAVAASGNVAALFQSGADAPLSYSLNPNTSGLPALSSGGVALTYAVSGNTLTASAGSTQVFTFTLNANGNYTFTLLAKLDHPAGADENDILINLGSVIRATDSDGDTVVAAADGLVVTVDDDTPIASATKLTGVVDEDGLAGGLAGGVGDVAGQAVAASGNVAALFQSGADAPLSYSLNPNTSGLPALSSGGVALTYAVSGNTLTASANGTDVFTFTLGSNGNYTFTLLAKLDHPAGADENDILINLGSVIRATDSDGDTVVAAADGLVVTVDDDTPIASATKLTGVVDEDGLAGGLAGGVGDVAGQAVAASGNVAALFQSGADAPLSYSLNPNTSGLPALSSGGVALTYAVSGNTLTASANGTDVFTFTLGSNGNYTFTLLAKLDHPAGADENDILINLGSVIRATDSDGDTVVAAADGLVVTVDDDTPIASATKLTGVVDEDGLAGGLAGGTGDVAGQAVAASGNVAALFQSGADAPLSYSLNPNTSGLPALSSGGVALTYAVSGNTLTASANGTDVFTFTLGSNGNYTFTLLAKLDHPAGADENDILINLGSVIRATDSDGDTVVAAADGLVVTVDDDTPIASTNKLTGVVDEDGLAGGLAGGVGDVAGQAVAASGNVAALFQSGADAPLSYSLNPNTSGLPALSSGGVALTYAVSGNTLTASANGTDVFTFTLGSNGNYTFTLLAKLDHPAGADENDILINLGSVIRATDSDGDTVVAAADGLVVTVDDDTPIASTNKLTGVVDEDGLAGGLAGGVGDVAGQAVAASGNVAALFQSGADAPLSYSLNPNTSGLPALSSGGVALTYAVSGNTLTASAGSTQVFTFTLNANGNYTFTLLAKLDHPAGADENDILINLGSVIRATDSDGDTVVAAADGLVVTVDDDTPIASATKLTGVVDEDGLAGGLAGGTGDVAGQAVAASGNVAALFQSGADAPLSYSLNPNTSGLPALSSGGVALTYAVSGNTLTASANGTDVFTFTLGSNGNYTFTLLAKLDHPAGADENDILINLGSVIRATDSDGDTVVAAADGLVVTVDDDTPIASTNKLTGVVDEDGLAGGLAGGVGDVAGQAVAASGNVAALFQSGADAPLSYSLNPNTSGLPALSSGGVALTYAVSGNTLTASANGTDVFTFTLGSNGNYTFTLLAKLDHPAGADENDILINLGSVIRATDSDGDTVVAAADGLVVTVDDDTPIASATKLTGVVDEDGLAGGLAGGVGDVAGQAVAASGNVAALFQSGADAPLSYSLNPNTSGLPALSSGGVALTYAVSGNTLTASAGSTPVFTFTLNANGNYTFTLLAKLDHPAGADENDILINLGSVIRATDSDGDTVVAAADGLVVTVDDDTPIASATKLTGVVDEDGLAGGLAGGVGDVAGQAVAASGNVAALFQSGADAPLSYSLNPNTSGLPALSSGGVALTYAVSGNTLTASAGSTQVFTFTLNANGNYTFTLLAKLDHPAGADENDILINLGSVIRATDSDGDTVVAAADGLVVTVDDDTPIASATKLTGVVDEDGLAGGLAGGTGDVAGQAVAASGNVAALFQSGADAPLSYSLNPNTSGLPALSSGGVALTYAVSGNTLTASANGTDVFTFTLGSNGNYTFTLLAKLDHPAGADENDILINLGSVIRATDSDGDTVVAAADGLVVTVDDDTPIASATKLTGVVDEDGLAGGLAGGTGDVAGQAVAASGNVAALFQSGADAPLSYSLNPNTSGLPALSSGGVALTYAVSGNTLTASANGTDVFTFTLGSNGNYTFTLLAKLDHPAGADENDILINLGSVIRATDSDGDTVVAAADGLVVTVDDDTPIASTNKLTGVVDEDGLAGGLAGGVGDVAGQAVAASGNVAALFQSGADAPLSYSLNPNTSGLPALSSGGVALTYAVSGNTLTASANGTDVFTFTLGSNGNYTFTLLAKLDHPAGADENDILINLGSVIRATDSDGDTVVAAADGLVVTVDDDTPIASTNKLTGVVDEDGLAGGLAGGVGDVAGQAVAASGNVAALFQSGADAPLSYSLNPNTSGLPALSSGGVALTYAVSGNTLTASAGSTQVFTFTLNANGNYTFTLLAKLDHPAGADENDILINLGSVIRATDSDGDTVVAAADGLVVTVDDDTPIASATKLTGVVDEDGLAGGLAGGVGDVAGQAVAASGNVAALFQSGADAPLSYSLNPNTSGLPALSSGGVALTYAVSGNTLTASANGTDVFTFTLGSNGNYTFTLLAKLDHPAGADENDILINLGSVIRATDSDGDTVVAAADGLVVTVDDDTPIASATKLTGVVDEDGLAGGLAGGVGDVAGQAVAASGNVAALFQSGADAPLSYSLNPNTSGLPALSSGGVALTYAVSGNTLTASAGSTQVFTFTLNANGNYTFTLLAKLDHPAGADENDILINLGSVIRATDSDGDTVVAAADGLVVTVDDDTPIASTNKLTGVVDEDGLAGGLAGGVGDVAGQAVAASGNVAALFQSGADAPLSYSLNPNTSGLPALSSGGVALTYAVSGNTLTASAGSTQVFTFTLNANGNYTFTLLAKLDHPAGADENDILINLGSVIRATDSDGDTVVAAADGLVVTVDDDTPIASATKLTGVVDEDGLAGGLAGGTGDVAGQAVAASGNVAALFQSGADAPLSYSLNPNTSGLPALSSGGVALTYAVSGNTLTASANGTDVFTFTLGSNGNYTFTLLAKLDHPAGADENDILINLGSVIRATDSDGDTVVAAADGLVVTVDDDTPIASTNKLTGVVDEDGLAGGLAGGVGDVAGQAVAASGNVAALFQSGADAPLSYSLNPNTSGLPALSSGGVALTYAVSGNTLTASANGTDVFTFTLGSNGNYTFTLLAKLDHPAGADENDILINLGSVIRATDSDGDTVVAAADGLVVTVDDDTPIASATKLTGVVDEDGLAGGLAGGVGDVAGQAVAASGNVAALFQSGADAPLSYSLNPNTSGLPALSSGGVALTYAVSGNTLTASANGTDVFTFTLGSNGNYTFTLLAKLDHPAGADENDILINLGSVIRATDSDGDTVVAAADGLVVTVDDDTPVASATKLTGVVDEDGLAGGLAGGTGDVAGQAVAASGNVAALFQSGADAPLSYSLNPNTSGLPALSSGGVALTYAVSGNTLTASAGSTPVFTFTLNANGNYTFTLLAKLDHPAGADENDILINLGSVIRATDSDGDTVVAAADGLVVTVDDDTPIASATKLTGVVDEDGLAGGLAGGVGDVAGQAVAASGNVAALFQSGADAPLSYSLNPNTSGLPALSSGGVALTYAVSGNTLTASAGSTPVFTFTLNANGNYTFTLLAKLDHPAGADENDILINLGSVIRATDSDGDTVVAAADGLVVTVDDDTPIASATKLTGVVDEDGLAGGLAGGVGDVAGQAVAASGNVAALFQSGADAPLSYSLNPNTSGLPVLSSGGVALTYAVSGNTLTASAGSTQVFTFTLNANGNYTFTLLAKLDHPAGADENDILINLGSVIRATDSDGDTVVAAADGLVVTVDDDTPIAGAISVVADEDNLPRGNNDTASGDAAQSNLTGTLPVNFGADGAGSIDFQGMHGTTAVIGNTNITYNWNSGTNTLTAYKTGGALGIDDVFKIVVNPNTGAYTFTLLAAINHHAVADNTEGLVDPFVNLNYRVIDGDGDTAIGTLKVTIDDDMPKAFTPEEGFVTNQAGIVRTFDLDFDANIDNNVGADQPGTIAFSGITNGQLVTGTVDGVPNQTLTSGGSAIHYYVSGNNVVEGWINGGPGDVGSTIVFRTTLQPDMNYNASNDTYKFEIFQPISTSTNVSITNFNGVNATSREFIYLENASAPGEDILFSAYIRNDNGSFTDATVNTSTQGIGVNNQNMNDRENLRLDFVRNASTNGTTSNMTYEYDDHYTVNNFSFKIVQVTGNPPAGSIEVWVRAYNADDDDPTNNTVSSANNLAHQDALRDDPQVALTQILVNGVPVTPTAVNASGGYLISGLNLNDTITLRSANGYDRVEIENARSGAHGVSNSSLNGETFDIGLFSYNTIKTTPSEININMGLSLTDSDGDKITSSIEINLAPSVFKVGENVDDTSSSNILHRVGGDTGVVDGSGGADILVGDVGGVEIIGTTARIAFILDESGSMGQNFGGTTRLEVLKQTMTDILTELSNTPNASITVHLVKFASVVNGTGTFEITGGELQQALDFISGLQIQQGLLAGTNYEAALGQTIQWYNSQSGTVDVQQTLFFTDGAPTFYMDGNSTEYTNIARVYGNGSQTEEVLWENLFGEHAGNEATWDRFNHLGESHDRDLDGQQNYYVDTDGDGDFEIPQTLPNDLVKSVADTFNEVDALQAYGPLRAVSIADNFSVYLQEIDSTGQPYVADSPEVLQDILDELNPFNVLLAAGSDTIQANEENDLIFGDALFTDKLAEDEGLDLPKGSGWAVFEELEANHGWSRQDTLDYIKNHADELGRETVLSSGSKRSGGHDTISGGQGDDRIYGQEGNDIIDAGSGDDVIVGGTGNDTLTGGSGADQFILVKGQGGASAGAAPIDTITDFEVNIDKIVINGNNITGVSVSTPVSNTYTITVNYSDAATEHFKVTLSNGAVLNDSGKTHLNGVVISGGTATIDGTIVGAVLYLDLNANNQEDEGERLGITNQYGHVEWFVDLSKFDVNGDGQYVIGEARAVQTGGFDIDTGLSYEINLYGPVGSAVISPLTSLLQAQLEAGMDYETANAALVVRLGLPEGTQIISFNPITGSGEVLAQNAGVMTAAIQFAEIAAIHYSTDESHVSFAVFEAISKALLDLPEGIVADFSDRGFLQSISHHLGLDAQVTSDIIDYMATSQKALESSILTLAPGEDALTAISKIQHVTQGIYAQAIEMALIGYLPLDALKNMSAVLNAYADGDITDEQLNSFEDKLSAVVVNWEDNNVTDTSHQASLQTEHNVDDSSAKSEVNDELAQEVNTVITDFMDEHNIPVNYYNQQAQMAQETQEEQQPTEAQAEETTMHDDVVQDLLLDDHSLTMLANNPELNGGNGNDVLHGTTGNDFIRGGQGNDMMTGGGGVDTFFWLSGDEDGGVDTITDFKANPVDQSSDASVLNLSDLLSDADLETNSLDNYLNVSTTEEGDTAIKVDPNGNGNFDAPAQTIILEDVDLTAVFATNNSHDIVNQMIANGNLIVEQ